MNEEINEFENFVKRIPPPTEKKQAESDVSDFEKWTAEQNVVPSPAPVMKKSREEYVQLMKESEDKVKRANSVKNFSDYYLHNFPIIKGIVDYFTEGTVEDEINYVDNLKYAMDKNVSPELIRQYRSTMKKKGLPNFNMMEKSGQMSFAAKMTNWLENGEIQRQVALKAEQHRKAAAGSPEEERLGKEVAALVEQMEKKAHEQALPDNMIEDVYRQVGEMMPGMAHALGISSTKGMLITSLIAGAGYIAGAKLTVPATLMAGTVATSFFIVEESAKQEAGNLYLALLKEKDEKGNKLDPNYCKWAAGLGGWAAGGMELMQFKSLAKLYPGSNKLVARALAETFKSKALRQKFATLTTQLPIEAGKQTFQEVGQGLATEIVATEFVKQLNNLTEGTNFKSADIEKVAGVIIDNLKTYPAFLAMGAPGTAMRMGGAVVGGKDKKTTLLRTKVETDLDKNKENALQFGKSQTRIDATHVVNREVIEQSAANNNITLKTEETPEGMKYALINEDGTSLAIDEAQADYFSTLKEKQPTPDDALIAEARKYKTVEEFVKAQGEPLYHSTRTENIPSINQKGFTGDIGEMSGKTGGKMEKGVFLYGDKESADIFGKNFKDSSTVEVKVNGKIYDANSESKYGWEDDLQIQEIAKDKKIINQLRKDGYVGVNSVELGTPATFVFEPKTIKTKAQLTDIWNKAQEGKADTTQAEADKQRELEELDETATESLDMLDENDRVIMAGWGNMKSLPNGEVVYQKTGEGTQLNPARAPENPLIVQSREGLAEHLKYEGDPYSTEFDKIAKDYAEQDNRDGIIYAETKDGTPEMRVFTKREGTSFIIKGQDPTEALKDKSLTFKKFDAFFEEMDARRQELEKEAFIGEPLDKAIKEMSDTSGTNELFREKMYDLYEQARTEQVNMLLNMASRMTEKQGENLRALDQYAAMDDEASGIAVQKAIDKVSRKLGNWRRKAIALAKENIRHYPLYSAMEHIVKSGGLNEEALKVDYPEVAADIAKRRPGLVSKKGTLKADEIAQEFGFEDADTLVEGIFEWKGLENEAVRVANAELEQILQMLGENERDGFLETYREEKEAALKKLSAQNKPRPAKGIGKVIKKETGITRDDSKQVTEYEALTAGYKRAREAANIAVRWSFRRRAEMRNIQEYLHLTDAQMQKVSRKSPYLMTDAEYADYKEEIMRRAVELQENRHAKEAVLKLIAEKKLRKVNVYRQLLGYPPITKMTTEEANDFFDALNKYQEGDVFLSKRKLETIDRSKLLEGVRTEREVVERIAQQSGKDPKDLKVATVPRLMLFYWDSLLKRQGAFWDIFVTRITESLVRGEVRHTQIEDLIRVLGKKAHSSRSRSIKEMILQTDQKIFEWLSAEDETAQAQIEAQLTDAELDLAHSMRQYFTECLEYLQAMEILGEGRNGYMTHVRQGFLENWAEEGLIKAVKNIRKQLKDDEARFITRDENGQILSPEKHFVYAMHRSGEIAPSKNVIRAFLAYSGAFERMRSLNETLPELMALGQITAEHNPLVQHKMEEAIRNYLNNKKGIRFTWGGAIPQGSMRERALNMIQSFTSLWILGGNLFVGTANVVGEQVAALHEYGHKSMALGAKRLVTAQGRHIVELNKSWVSRTAWDDFTAPGKTLGERLDTAAFALFAEAARLTNAQVLLASLTDAEFNSGEVTPARLADIKLRMGNVRMVQGTASIAGSSAAGRNWTMFKRWAIPLTEYVARDIYNLSKDIVQGKEGMFTSEHAKRLGSSLTTLGVVAVAYFAFYPDDDDDSYSARFIRNLFREAMTIVQAFTSLSGNLLPVSLAYLSDLVYAIGLCLSVDDTKRKRGIREIQRFKPGVWRTMPVVGTYATEDTRKKKRNKEW